MSAPQTNLEKQERWHRGPLIGMAAVIVFVGVMFLWVTGVFSPIDKVTPPVVSDGTAPVSSTVPAVAPDTATAPATAAPVPAMPKADAPAPANN